MKAFIVNDSEEFKRVSRLRELGEHYIFADINKDYGILIDKFEGEEVAIAFKVCQDTPLAIIDKLKEEITEHLLTNIDTKRVWCIDLKGTLKNLTNRTLTNFTDVKISSVLSNCVKFTSGLNQVDNFCDFITFLESRKKVYELTQLYISSDIPSTYKNIYDIMVNSIEPYIEIENKGFLFEEKSIDSTLLSGLDIRGDRMYFNYNLTGTITGRTSSKIHPLPKVIKKFIFPDANKVFVNFDYNAGEARILAHYSEDENLIDIFKNNQDLHKINAALIFGKKSEEEVNPQERTIAKLVFFSIINGVSIKKLTDDLHKFKIESTKAHEIKSALQKIYKKAFNWLNQVQSEAVNKKSITNIFGRTRFLEKEIEFDSESTVKRMASNAIIQSTLSDFKLIALSEIHKAYKGILVAEFHDAILVELEFDDKIKEIMENISGLMTNIGEKYNFKIPLKTNYEIKKHL